MAMPWRRAKQLAAWYREDPMRIAELNALFDACFRIQSEASEAAGHYIPLIVENVRGAQPWVGEARAHFGSFYLWGDVGQVGNRVVAGPLIFGAGIVARSRGQKCPGFRFDGSGKSFQSESVKVSGQNWSRFAETGQTSPHWNMQAHKNDGGSWFNVAHNTTSGIGNNPDGRKGNGSSWFTPGEENRHPGHWKESGCVTRQYNSKDSRRRAASAQIAKIPFPLAVHIARAFKPQECAA
jgi:hypothetical protein